MDKIKPIFANLTPNSCMITNLNFQNKNEKNDLYTLLFDFDVMTFIAYQYMFYIDRKLKI